MVRSWGCRLLVLLAVLLLTCIWAHAVLRLWSSRELWAAGRPDLPGGGLGSTWCITSMWTVPAGVGCTWVICRQGPHRQATAAPSGAELPASCACVCMCVHACMHG